MNRRHFTPALLSLLLLAACAPAEPPQPRVYSDPSQVIRVTPGARFSVALKSNQSTGYQWVLVDSAGLGPLRGAGTRYEVPRELRDRDGAGGTETWTFLAQRAGAGTIVLVHMRPWDPATADDTSRFRVTVE